MLKTISSITNALGALNYKGTWNASTNTPTLTSSVGEKGDYYVVSVAGSTNLNGEALWGVGDWATFNGSVWQRVEGGNTINATTVSASTSVTTPIIQAPTSAGGTLKNDGGTNQMQWGLGGGNNLSLEVATNINPANAAVAISPTGTGTVTISPAGALTINPTTASTINNTSIGATTASTGRFTSVTATTGNVVIGTSGQGIDFSATPGTGTSELLDDYEEGTFTPDLTCATPGTLAVVYNTQRGRYQLVGNVCHVWINIQTDSVTLGTASGAVRITGLPFTSSLNGVESSMGSMMFQGITKAGYTQFSPQVVWTTTYMQITASATALNTSSLAIGELGAGTNLLNIYVAFIVA
jgi:hypothetical protein